ncbi:MULTISPECIES: DNA -binding domain-containing protein [Sphingobium]|uniref:DNA -binding domain-containing protein n=1 Tax=Sphingobium sp. MI1205 TaxID=407020 RepID=UPI003FA7145E
MLALRQLDRLLRGIPLPPRRDVRLRRLALALRASDALAAGASLRVIGTQILGYRDWPGDGECAKSSTRRIVDLAGALLESGPLGIFYRRV